MSSLVSIGYFEPRRILTAANPAYYLVELTTPEHLLFESAALNHNFGTLINEQLLHANSLTPADEEALLYLTYAIAIRDGKTRVFSFRNEDGPVVTIEYDTRTTNIRRVQGILPHYIERDEPYLPALCQTLHALGQIIPVGTIKGLPTGRGGEALTKDGKYVPTNTASVSDILNGDIEIDGKISPEQLLNLCNSPRIILNIPSRNHHSRLPTHIKASLRVGSTEFDLPLLETAGDITADNADLFNVPKLVSAGDISASKAKAFLAPNLKFAGRLLAYKAQEFDIASLEEANEVNANSVSEFKAPLLQTASDVSAVGAKVFSAPRLRMARMIHSLVATHIDLPKLEVAYEIEANNATDITFPRLKAARRINVQGALRVSMPQLRVARRVHADVAEYLYLPRLKVVEKVRSPKVPEFNDLYRVPEEDFFRRELKIPVRIAAKVASLFQQGQKKQSFRRSYPWFNDDYKFEKMERGRRYVYTGDVDPVQILQKMLPIVEKVKKDFKTAARESIYLINSLDFPSDIRGAIKTIWDDVVEETSVMRNYVTIDPPTTKPEAKKQIALLYDEAGALYASNHRKWGPKYIRDIRDDEKTPEEILPPIERFIGTLYQIGSCFTKMSPLFPEPPHARFM